MTDDDIERRLLDIFQNEAAEHLDVISASLLALEQALPGTPPAELVDATLREVHTLKGAARSVSQAPVEAICQSCESVLSRVMKGASLTPSIIDGLQTGMDAVTRLLSGAEAADLDVGALTTAIERSTEAPVSKTPLPEEATAREPEAIAPRTEPIEPPSAAPAPSPGPVGAAAERSDTVRLTSARLDAFLIQVEDLLSLKLAADQRVQEARALADALVGTLERVRRGQEDGGPGDIDGSAVREMETRARDLVGSLVQDQRTAVGTVDRLQEEARLLRMMPASRVLGIIPRMIRDLARELGKEAVGETQGSHLDVDRRVLEAIRDPLLHLLRNAVDHGIEAADDRVQAGKPRAGRVKATIALLETSRIEVRVEDDGQGIDLEQVRAAAIRGHLLTAEEAEAASDAAVLDLIYRSGFSTSPIITRVSGRGLGMAIVREGLERLGGEIHVETRPGLGTTVRLIIPASIATFHGLLVRAARQLVLFPIDWVERAIQVEPDAMEPMQGRGAVDYQGEPLVVTELSAVLRVPAPDRPRSDGEPRPCIVVRSGDDRIGLLVDEVLGDREAVVKELRPPLIRVRHIAAAGLLGTGEVVPILRPADVLRSAQEQATASSRAHAEEPSGPRSILVVDDSITTRTMERNLLESAGYRVEVAVDGLDGWTRLKTEPFDLVVSDVDMPGLDGFELTERIRADARLADLPVVLVTAKEEREDKERGIDVGANAYLIKSSFDQSNLLEIIRRLM